MQTKTLHDGLEVFQVTFIEATASSPVVLLSVGSGGQPERHATLISVLADAGCTIVAPHFERLTSPVPSESDLTLRAKRLSLALDSFAPPGARVTGVGHSIGAATLIALAGGQIWLRPDRPIEVMPDHRLIRLALLATPTGFFQAPGAMDAVRVPMLAWVGSEDHVTPPAQTEWLAQAMKNWQPVDVRVTAGAGHFSFMDLIPPGAMEPLPDKPAFLREYSSEVCKFLVG